ncbi:hypothetical protein B0T18DRAFT_324106 [Schizothecium vesticola]|uniref:DNA mismatch repair protein HSM3 N-terminal domain-containing protein n=1 Tax=Schizothecium vesticola TaxID=314040 RepID=A0AA40K657_9PEZI|nr:hypothetical protein B0T18DRAFT_324106 [Schizothecium vesticola]
MEDIPVTGLDELDKHLDDLVQDSTIPLNAKLIDDVELQLTESNTPPLVIRFLPRLTTVLKQYPSDPTVLANLASKLLRPVSFTQILSLASPESLIQALEAPSPSANLLAMTVLHKATASPSLLSDMPDLLAAFVRRWLASPFVEVGQLGGKVLADLLEADRNGKLWRLLFTHGEPIYTLLVDLCVGRHPDTHDDAHQLSLAQARLLRVLPRIASLNLSAVASAEPPSTSTSNGHRPGGLLQFAALRMVDKSDRLLHLNLVDFFKGLVVVMRTEAAEAFTVETIRPLLVEAMAEDELLREELVKLPEEMVEEEVEGMRAWLQNLVPGQVWEVPLR